MPTLLSNRPKVLITMGDPSGIGPEVALKALASPRVRGLADFLLIGDGFVMGRCEKKTGLKLRCPLLDLANVRRTDFRNGVTAAAFGKAAIQYIDKAVELIGHAEADCLVTGPINKAAIHAAGLRGFEGHTEYLAENMKADEVVMMFVGRRLKITLVTRHAALKDIPQILSVRKIYKTIAITHEYLKKFFGIRNPRIGVAGLNPHAGEGGSFGTEEKRIIIPAIRKASREMRGISGPFPPDVIFYHALTKRFDAVVAMYHDQALIPFKMLHFKDGVNLTLGLPFVRTSPDHGTAFDIAGKGIADPSSMIEAMALACRFARKISSP